MTRSRVTQIAIGLVASILLVGCGSAPRLPDENEPETKADAQRVADVVAADMEAKDKSAGGAEGTWLCLATLLGRDGDALLAAVNCTGTYPDAPDASGFAGPVRVEGTDVRYAKDGSGYAASVRDMFGKELGDYFLDQ